MKLFSPYTVVLPWFNTQGMKEYTQFRFVSKDAASISIDRKKVIRLVRRIAKKELGLHLRKQFLMDLTHAGSKWGFRGMVAGEKDQVNGISSSEGSTAGETEE